MQKAPETPLTCDVRAALEEYTQRLMNLYPERFIEKDHEAWREENRKKQAAGVRFEKLWYDGFWHKGKCDFTGKKEDYREVPQEVQKECDMRIPEASREVLKQWQANGLKFNVRGIAVRDVDIKFTDIDKNIYTIPEQPIPEGMSVETVEAMWRQGLRVEYKHNGKTWRDVALETEWNRGLFEYTEILQCLRIPFQPIPEKLLEVPQEPHAAERALWKAQREAGTNEVWQFNSCSERGWIDIPIDDTPNWMPNSAYRVKPMKLTAKICRVGKAYPMSYIGQDWEFTGTREEYRAECKKYGYAILSEIKEVVEKPKTVKYYFAMLNSYRCTPFGRAASDKDQIIEYAKKHCYTIIGDIEERDVEV